MPFDSAPTVRELVGNDSANTIAINWIYYDKTHVKVRKRSAAGVITTLTHITDYTLTAAGVAAGGTCTLLATPATGETVWAWLNVPQTQGRRYSVGGGLAPPLLNEDFDKLVQRTAVLEEAVKRAFRLPFSDNGEDMEGETELADLKGGFAYFDDTTGKLTGMSALDASDVAISAYMLALLTSASEAALKAAINAEAGVDFLAFSNRVNNLDQDFVDVASATTTDLGTVASRNVRITGTTTITGLGTVTAGLTKRIRFAGVLQLTHNGTSLILPTAANITTAANDCATFVSLGSGNWICTQYQRASGLAVGSTTSPSFRATTATAQSLTQNTYVKIQYGTETFDTGSYYDNATNYRFLPLVAGKYQVNARIASNTTKAESLRLAIYKNGSIYSEITVVHTGAGADDDFCLNITDIVDMNGSTDYIEIFVRSSDATPSTLVADANKNVFSAVRVP